MIVKLTKEQIQLLKEFCTEITTEEGTYMYLPFWFKDIEKRNEFELLTFEHLPSDLIDTISTFRKSKEEI